MAPGSEKEILPDTSSYHRTSQDSSHNTEGRPEPSSETPTPTKDDPPDAEYPPRRTVVIVMAGIFMTAFLVALDRTIIATAIPRITDEFHSLGDIGWYASAYLLTACSFQLLLGRIYTFYNPKWVYLVAIGVFEVGSIVCAAAPNSTAFIIGRAVAGMGSAGIFSGAIILMLYTIPLEKRPSYIGVMGLVFGVASVSLDQI
jgi:MFS family permease